MSRSLIASVVVAFTLSSGTPVVASELIDTTADTSSDKAAETTEPTAPVLDNWNYDRPTLTPALKSLVGTYAVLQGLDVYSTAVARRAGAREVNPVMDGNMGQVIAAKAVSGLVTYYAVQKMAKKNRKGAIITMAIINGVTAAVVANNMRNSRR